MYAQNGEEKTNTNIELFIHLFLYIVELTQSF